VGHRAVLDDLETRKVSCLYEDLTQLHSFQHAVARLVEALRYKPEGREFDSRWCQWNFSLTILSVAPWPWG
jgi:hypothetical protein